MRHRLLMAGVAAISVTGLALSTMPSALADNHVTITFAGWADPPQIKSYTSEIQAFEKLHPNITVNTQFLPWSGYETKLVAESASHTLPDVMVTSGSWFSEFAAKGSYLNLTSYFKKANLKASDFSPGGIVGNSIKGKLYMVPNYNALPGGQVVMLYNKAMFQKAHVPIPNSKTWTWNDYLKISERLTLDSSGKNATQKGFDSKHIVQWGNGIGESVADNVWNELLPAYGGWYWNSTHTKSTMDSPAAMKAAEYLKLLVTSNASISPSAAVGLTDPFAAGKVAMDIFWTNDAQTEVTQTNFPVGVLELPLGPAGRGMFKTPASAGIVTNGWAISANTQHPTESWELLNFLATSPVALKARGTTGVEGVAYAPLNQTWLKMLSPMDRLIVQTDNAQYASAPVKALAQFGGEYSEFWNQVMKADLQKFYLGQESASAALKSVQTQSDQLLKQYK